MGKKAKKPTKKQIEEPEADASEELQAEKKANKGGKKQPFDLTNIFS